MKLFEVSMLEAYEPYVTKRGYHTVKLNERKAKRIRFNQHLRDIFVQITKIFKRKNYGVHINDSEIIVF